MSKTFSAVYQDGVFRPEVPPDLPEGTSVRLTIVPPPRPLPSDGQAPLTGQALLDRIKAIASKFNPSTDRPEVTSNNVDAILYGGREASGDVR